MTINVLAVADALSNEDLLVRLEVLAGHERAASAELVAHLAALLERPSVYAARGFGSLFAYCTQALRLSEDAACNRIEAAKACRRFPAMLDLLGAGSLTLTSVRLLGPHLTPENHEGVLQKAVYLTRPQLERLIAELAPRPDVPPTIRKLPEPAPLPMAAVTSEAPAVPSAPPPPLSFPPPRGKSMIQATAPARYRAQFTMSEEMHARLRRVQDLLRREIPDGDPAAIFDRALELLEAEISKRKLGAAARPRIRPGTDKTTQASSRQIPRAVRRVVWARDGGQCAYASPEGRRCSERTFLEFHHVVPYAEKGPPTAENIALRCRRHNQYEAEVVFGPGRPWRATSGEWGIRTPPPV
jgi:5-methylcytosine-specific restriction endonuclease McrA